jgi:hypothetical protein
MPLFQKFHYGSGERDGSHNVQGKSQEPYTSSQQNYNREYSQEQVTTTKSIPNAPIEPPLRYYPEPSYNYEYSAYAEDNFERYQKLPVREMLPAQRVPQYFPSHEHYQNLHHHLPYHCEKNLSGEKDKTHANEKGQPQLVRRRDDFSHHKGTHRKKAKLSENEDQSMIEDAELLASLFKSTENQKHDLEGDDVVSSIVPSEVDCQSPIQTKESASPKAHPLSGNREQGPEERRLKVESKSPRGSADSNFMPQNRFRPTKPYSRPPFHSGMQGSHVLNAVPPPIPFPFERHPMDFRVVPSHRQCDKSFPMYPPIPLRPSRESHLPQLPHSDYYHHPYQYPPHTTKKLGDIKKPLVILKRKCAWKNCPELEKFLIDNREEYLKHSAMNYTSEQKIYNNKLTERLLEEAKKHGYAFDLVDFNFVAIRDRIRCFYKSYVQNCKKRGIIVGYDENGNKKVRDKDSKVHNEDIRGNSENDNEKKNDHLENIDSDQSWLGRRVHTIQE